MPTAAIPLALELFKIGKGAADESKAKSEAELLKATRPKYEISPESTNELNLAESELQQGIGAKAERAYTNQLDKGTANSLSALLMGGGNLNSVGDVFANAEDGRQRLTMLNENNRLNQINNLVTASRNMTEQRDKQFMYNEDQWWKNDAQANAQSRQKATDELWSGINGAAGMVTQYGQNAYEARQMDKYLNPEKYAKKPKIPSTTNTTRYMPDNITSGNYSQSGGGIESPNFYEFNQ